MTTMIEIRAEMLKGLPGVAKVAEWRDRYYVSLKGFSPKFAGDRNLKIWMRGDILVIEGGKGFLSPGMSESLKTFRDEIAKMAEKTSGYSDSIEATYTFK